MPGLVGHVALPPATADIGRALQKLSHFATFRSASHAHGPGVRIGRVARAGRDPAVGSAVAADGTVAVHLAGHARRTAAPYGDVTAADLLAAYRSGRFDPDAADGAFVVCIVDLDRRQLMLCNDRLGTLPMLYAATAQGFAFAPEAKALFPTLGLAPRLARRGVIDFLTAGYCLGETTLFEGVRCLGPGTRLTVDLDSLALDTQRYWRMTYRADPALGRARDACAVLTETIARSQDSLLGPPGVPFDILLSGGLDSRCMLAGAVRSGRIPTRTFGWGVRDDVPYTDPYIAAALARRFGVRFDFLRYDTEQFVANAESWSYLSELSTDNMGWYAEGSSMLLDSYDPGVEYTLVGDEAWGNGGEPPTRNDAIDNSLPYAVAPALLRHARPAARAELADSYAASVEAVVAGAANDALNDLKDYLYIQGRVPRFIFALGYYKELATEIRRPFLTRSLLTLMQAMPGKFRYTKNLYRLVLERSFPELRRFPMNLASSLPDWRHALTTQPDLRRLFGELLGEQRLESSIVSRWLEPAAVAAAWRSFAATPAAPVSRTVPRGHLLRYRLVPESLKIRHARRGAQLDGIARRTDLDCYRALALLVLFEAQLGALAA